MKTTSLFRFTRLWPTLIAFTAIQTITAQIRVLSVTDSATFTLGLPAYGSLASVFCTGLTCIVGTQSAKQYPLPYEIAGVSVRVSGYPAPLLGVADLGIYQQINIQVPWTVDSSPPIDVSQFGYTSTMQISSAVNWQRFFADAFPSRPMANWGVFFTGTSGYAVVQHADASLVTPDHPARPSEILAAYATGLDSFEHVSNSPALGAPSQAYPLRFCRSIFHLSRQKLIDT